MKIAFLSRYQNTISRGAENFVEQISKRLSKNHTVDIFAGSHADNLHQVIKGSYDIVIPINGRLQSLKASLGRFAGKYRLLITGHSGSGRDDIWNVAVCRPDVFVTLTEAGRQWVRNWAFGVRVVKIPNGVDLNRFSPLGPKINIGLPKPVILSAGALVVQKQHDKAIRAAAQTGGVSLFIAGEGPERKKLEKLGRELLGKRFRIAGFDRDDMPKVYRSCDLFTLPSWERESFGIVYLEAMASGLGVVAPDDASRREIAGNAGLFFNPDDLSDFAGKLKQALSVDWSKKARAQAEKFSWDKTAGEYENLMFDMINNV